ncbi:MAG: amidohydrolase family protein [Planctomycetota bacterium]|jgi:hypothetical protein|nr:amidohydrolase family protein [Planctomycetota bacterium]MDP6940778.1 amidohydrolase family protein [Planctomycetota bacterium]
MILSTLLFAFLETPLSGDVSDAIVLQPKAVILPDGSLSEGVSVLLRGDKILAVGKSIPMPPGVQKVQLDGVLAPGFIDAFSLSYSGAAQESSQALTPNLRIVDELQAEDTPWEAALQAGITSVHVVPNPKGGGDPYHVLAGWSALIRTGTGYGVDNYLESRTLIGRSRQTLGTLSDMERSREGGPSSLAGISGMLADVSKTVPLARHGALAFVDSAEGVRLVQSVSAEQKFETHFLCRGDVASYGGELNSFLVGLSAMTDTSFSPRLMETWRRLHSSNVRIAFGTDGSNASLRETSMAFARATGDSPAAMAAITSNAAEIAGMGGKLGVLKPGARADLVLWSAHPLDASARVQAVMLAGKTAWSAPYQEVQE